MTHPEAFALLVLPNVTLTTGLPPHQSAETGGLALECVTVPHPGGTTGTERDVYLVLRLNASETPLDPDRAVQRIDKAASREYVFNGTQNDPEVLRLSFPLGAGNTPPGYMEDLDTFEGILGQYHAELRSASPFASPSDSKAGLLPPKPLQSQPQPTQSMGTVTVGGVAKGNQDLRGHLVMIDESTGEVVGQVEDRLRIREDPVMHTKGHENDPVVIEVAEQTPEQEDANALEAFARSVPPEDQNWVTKGATVVSHAISMTTNLVITTITAASNYYVNHSTPSPHHSGASTPATGASSSTLSKDGPSSPPGAAPPLPPRPKALVFLTSERTKSTLNTVHAVSGEAVKVSAKTVGFIDKMIRKAIGAGEKRDRTAFLRTNSGAPAGAMPLSPIPPGSTGGVSPPPYSAGVSGKEGLGPPQLPPRGGGSRSSSLASPPPLPPRKDKMGMKDKVLISADLILSTIDHSTRQLLDTGTSQLGKVMQHKYGDEAAESTTLMANTARNVGLVYVDMRGIGRRALLKRAGRTYVKTKLSSRKEGEPVPTGEPSTTKQ